MASKGQNRAATGPPFRADHVGSLLRPDELRRAYRDVQRGAITPASFLELQDRCVRDVVTLQEDAGLQSINDCLEGRGDEVTVAMHLCRGNFKGRWLSAGGYEAIAERLFHEIDVDAFFLEYDSPRAGDFAPLRFAPQEKRVVLGLISSKSPELESVEGLRRRIDEAGTYLPLGQMGISPQCGFASTVAGNPLTVDDELAKLELVTTVAHQVWGDS